MSVQNYPTKALFGGSFDPVHWGHLRPLKQVAEQLNLKQIELLPCQIPPHKSSLASSVEQRIAMLEQVCEAEPLFSLNKTELSLPAPSYTVRSLRHLRTQNSDLSLWFIMGMDSFSNLANWYQWQQLFALSHIVVCRRPGYALPINDLLTKELNKRCCSSLKEFLQQQQGLIMLLDTELQDISSTQIRQLLASNNDLSHKVPESVLAYIRKHGLYAQH